MPIHNHSHRFYNTTDYYDVPPPGFDMTRKPAVSGLRAAFMEGEQADGKNEVFVSPLYVKMTKAKGKEIRIGKSRGEKDRAKYDAHELEGDDPALELAGDGPVSELEGDYPETPYPFRRLASFSYNHVFESETNETEQRPRDQNDTSSPRCYQGHPQCNRDSCIQDIPRVDFGDEYSSIERKGGLIVKNTAKHDEITGTTEDVLITHTAEFVFPNTVEKVILTNTAEEIKQLWPEPVDYERLASNSSRECVSRSEVCRGRQTSNTASSYEDSENIPQLDHSEWRLPRPRNIPRRNGMLISERVWPQPGSVASFFQSSLRMLRGESRSL